jgi:hypothetical protein
VSATSMRRLALAAALAVAWVGPGCGSDPPAKKPEPAKKAAKPGAPDGSGAKGGAAKGGKGKLKGPQPLFTYPHVKEDHRVSLNKEVFTPDSTGDVNRDPFRSYLVEEGAGTGNTKEPGPQVDECEKRMVADQYGLRDLQLVGIVKKGTTAYALFIDTQSFGHIARRDDCLSKDKARVKEIGASSITVEIRGEAPPGAPPPPPREEEWKLHPEALDLGDRNQLN